MIEEEVSDEGIENETEEGLVEEGMEDKYSSETEIRALGPRLPGSPLNIEDMSYSQVALALKEFSNDDIEDLFEKNTDSFRCLAQALISRSSLLRHILYFFPEIKDPGIDEAFNYVEPEVQYDSIGVQKYISMCQDMKIGTISLVIRSLETDTLDLKYYGLSDKQFKAIFASILHNNYIKYLNLEENWISPESAYWLSEMLRENNSIRVINLKKCSLGVEGFKNCIDGFTLNQSLQEIDLSYNEMGDNGLKVFIEVLKENQNIQKLSLSHNNFGEAAAILLGDWLKESNNIQFLDLSWNNFYEGLAMTKFFERIIKNESLKMLNLAWNGIGNPSTFGALVKYLKTNTAIEHLDLSFNRLKGKMIAMLKAGLNENTSLNSINLGFNVITPDDALHLATVFQPDSTLQYMDLQNIFVDRRFLPIWKKLTDMGKSIRIEGITDNYTIVGPDRMKLLFERCRYLSQKPKKASQKKDFGTAFIWNLPDEIVDNARLKKLVKKSKIKLDNDLIEYLGNFFSKKKKRIDLKFMRDSYLEMYPETEAPQPKKKKGKKGKRAAKNAEESQAAEKPTTQERGVETESSATLMDPSSSSGKDYQSKRKVFNTQIEFESAPVDQEEVERFIDLKEGESGADKTDDKIAKEAETGSKISELASITTPHSNPLSLDSFSTVGRRSVSYNDDIEVAEITKDSISGSKTSLRTSQSRSPKMKSTVMFKDA